VGLLLRRWADWIDPDNTPPVFHQTQYSYTVERTTSRNPLGVALHLEDRGCPLYILDADWERAYMEADAIWSSPEDRLADMLATHGEPREDT
jgi:hypothetical protein